MTRQIKKTSEIDSSEVYLHEKLRNLRKRAHLGEEKVKV